MSDEPVSGTPPVNPDPAQSTTEPPKRPTAKEPLEPGQYFPKPKSPFDPSNPLEDSTIPPQESQPGGVPIIETPQPVDPLGRPVQPAPSAPSSPSDPRTGQVDQDAPQTVNPQAPQETVVPPPENPPQP